MDGWIKLYRNIMQSKTFAKLTAIQKLIAIYIILNANHKDGIWVDKIKGSEVPVKRGQLITSRKKIVEEWFKKDSDVTEQKVRTALTKLEKFDFITIESTNWYTLITVVNYSIYQVSEKEDNQLNNQDLTKPQPSPNQDLTTNKNVKNVKNIKKTSSRQPKTYAEDSSAFKMALYLHEKIMTFAESIKKAHLVRDADMQKWADGCRKILELDNRNRAEVRDVIDWATSDPFWQQNILSPDKLRIKYQDLCMKMGAKGSKSGHIQNANDKHYEKNRKEAEKIMEAMKREGVGSQATISENQQFL